MNYDERRLSANSRDALTTCLGLLQHRGPLAARELAKAMTTTGISDNWARSILARATRAGLLVREPVGNSYRYTLPPEMT